jgi:hypothetical protein
MAEQLLDSHEGLYTIESDGQTPLTITRRMEMWKPLKTRVHIMSLKCRCTRQDETGYINGQGLN